MDTPVTSTPQAPSGAAADPAAPVLTAAQQQVVVAVLAERSAWAGPLLPVLHGVQEALGFIPPAALPVIAKALSLSRAEVHGVVTYYHHFRTTPLQGRLVQVCRAEACRSMGAEALLAHAKARQGGGGGDTVEAAYCLGLCAQSPAVMIGTQLHARMTPARLDALLDVAATAATPSSSEA